MGDGADPVLEQIADAALAAQVEQVGGVGLLDVLAEHQNGQAGAVAAQRDRGAEAVVGVARGHPHIGDDDVGVVLMGRGDQRVGVGLGRRHPVAEAGEHADQAVPQQR
ncbi:hypothetical protein GCM10009579_12640 [Streptomyces javensis]|uniref:Uncharacterized protein n=1 Tax=Streptomyces javensis TaxID=114698 RepID=A0ABP4HDS4_9ACTN